MQRIPWTGGVNSSVDPGVLPANDLVQADNVIFTVSGTRTTREGFDYFDTAMPAVSKRSSSGTTRTIVFASTIKASGPSDHILCVGEAITVSSVHASYNGNYTVATITTTTVTNDTITYTAVGSLTEASTSSSGSVARNYTIIGLHDLWYFNSSNNNKEQYKIGVTSTGKFYRYDTNGKRVELTMSGAGATALAIPTLTTADMHTYNNKLIIFLSGIGNTPKYWDPMGGVDEWKDVPNAPDASMAREHLGRLFANDKTDKDLLHFCTTFDETEWQGVGDSGGIYVGINDGDPVGISAIKPPFKGRLFVDKGQRSFQVQGEDPETFQVISVSNGIGSASHKAAVSVDLDDVFYFSQRGAHSVITTDQFGDFQNKFLSREIQLTFNEWSTSRLPFMQGAYLPNLNSVVWNVAEGGQTSANALWLYNPTIQKEGGETGVWFRWPDIDAQSLAAVLEDGAVRLLCGTSDGRLLIGQNGDFTDYGTSGISFRVKTGTLYPDGNLQSVKAFKKITLFYKPRGRFSFTAYFKVDNFAPQAVSFTQTIQGDILGDDFTPGTSVLGADAALAPYTKDVYGIGRGFSLEIFQSSVGAQVEIYGFAVEYESADIADEVIQPS